MQVIEKVFPLKASSTDNLIKNMIHDALVNKQQKQIVITLIMINMLLAT
jgi:hypothetical protein